MNYLFDRILELESRIRELPRGTLTYKTIKGKAQPYLQWKENGKSKSRYIKTADRDAVMAQIEERNRLQKELVACLSSYYNLGSAAEVRESDSTDDFISFSGTLKKEKEPEKVAIGIQYFDRIRKRNCFYVDKTHFISDWWNSDDAVTLVTRPRRFGKTLMLSTVERFLSNQYDDQEELFGGLKVWNDPGMRKVSGTLPVIFLSFASVKEQTFEKAVIQIAEQISHMYRCHDYLMESEVVQDDVKERIRYIMFNPDPAVISNSVNKLAELLYMHFGEKPVILLDEYDTPMHEAYTGGYWDEMSAFMRTFFNATFKTNSYYERALLTGITRISRESMFSDLNNLKVVSTTTDMYTDAFGFTEDEVFEAMDRYGLKDREGVRFWYDGFTFGRTTDIYNPWSIINYLREGVFKPFWSNTSRNALASKLIGEGDVGIKLQFEDLLQGKTIHSHIEEEIPFGELNSRTEAVWSLLLASGYLKVIDFNGEDYELDITNYEVRRSFELMASDWFKNRSSHYNSFIQYLLTGDLEAMNYYMNNVTYSTFSFFDTGGGSSGSEPERFYHGFVLGLLVDLKDKYIITSNRESGFGRYDVQLMPKDPSANDVILLEFKVHNPAKEASLEDTVSAAHAQIKAKNYIQNALDAGIPEDKIRAYGMAFRGKEVLIG